MTTRSPEAGNGTMVSRRRLIGAGAAFMATALLLPRGWASMQALADGGAAGGARRDLDAGLELLPGDPATLPALAAALPGFACTRLRDWVLLSDAPSGDSRSALELLQATAAQVHRAMAAIGVAPRRPEQRHLAVLFRRLESYRNFAAAHDGLHHSSTAGHYAPMARRSAFAAPVPSRELRAAIAAILNEEAGGGARAGAFPGGAAMAQGAPSAGRAGAAARAAVDEAIDDLRQTLSRLTSHEAAHQVLVERGVHPEPGGCPAWLAEGLACSFESERSIGSFGPDFDVPARHERLSRLLAREAHLPLGVLVASAHRPGHGGPHSGDWYAQSWGLTAWLYRERPRLLAEYLQTLRRSNSLRAAERLESFERAFGSVRSVESEWISYWRAHGA